MPEPFFSAASSTPAGGARPERCFALHQFVKQSSIVNHCLPQVLGCGLALGVENCDLVPGPIVFHYGRMIHGDFGRASLKIAHRITAGRHDIGDQAIRFGQSLIRVIHEFRLNHAPRSLEAIAVSGDNG